MQLEYTAPEYVRDVIAGLGRTEAVKFSPNNRRLAIASFLRNRITIFELCIDASPRKISISDVTEISSTYLRQPHGIDFIDDEKIIVANRYGDAIIFELPSGRGRYELAPIEVIRSGEVLNTPGAVSITRKSQDFCEALICSNYGNKITRHLIHLREGCSVDSSEILLKKWLDFPDGVSVNGPWIAISNYSGQRVFLYENTGSLNEYSEPDGILRCAHHPHGLQFTSDGHFILVADAGTPYVHVYMQNGSGWRGVRSPLKSLRVLNDADFIDAGGTHFGPKGIDIDNSMSTFVATCEVRPLVFFDFAEILEWKSLVQRNGAHSLNGFGQALYASYERHCQNQSELEMKYELERINILDQSNQVVARLDHTVAALKNSRSWRVTAPLRWVSATWHRTFAEPATPQQ
jgi:hypothetical protein